MEACRSRIAFYGSLLYVAGDSEIAAFDSKTLDVMFRFHVQDASNIVRMAATDELIAGTVTVQRQWSACARL
jgi:hypothetical protein